jgi:hypothetical protein
MTEFFRTRPGFPPAIVEAQRETVHFPNAQDGFSYDRLRIVARRSLRPTGRC